MTMSEVGLISPFPGETDESLESTVRDRTLLGTKDKKLKYVKVNKTSFESQQGINKTYNIATLHRCVVK